ncbi:MAG: hypothetical protein AAF581_11400 [Planctomycetota bacterium]
MRICSGIVLCLLSVVLAGCTSPIDGGRGLPPFFESYPTPVGDHRWVARPFAMSQENRADEYRDFAALWPLYRNTTSKGRRTEWLLPLWYNSHHPNTDGTVDWDAFLFPLFFFGNDPAENGRYFLFFPLGGRWNGILGQDTADFALFPFYLRMRDRERISTHILWPFFNRVTGPYNDGLRVWPFYGRYRGFTRETAADPEPQLKYDRRYYLWPFFHAHENDLELPRPSTTRWFFPFYGTIASSNRKQTSVLWPLYQHETDEKREYVSHRSFGLGWNYTRSPELDRTDMWPLFGVSKTPDSYRQFALFPLQRYEAWRDNSRRGRHWWVLPFVSHHEITDLRAGTQKVHTLVWPFFRKRKEESGATYYYAPELLPYSDQQRIEPLYARFWRLYRAVDRGPGKGSAWELFYGLLRRDLTPERSWFSLFGGLFEWETKAGKTDWRVLYLPF